ncbi:hypothetical protein E2C01_016410 [Portunus trituberculatus]|uniref:Uncharacterized protein n=1 Tax=Portunus trituberculatus TaxID=210409 RepID=A0A5B7DR03_PORTR|nr:hypothetical protein [Portunus trituberculatus]
MPGATLPPAYLVEHTGRGLGGKVAATRALRLCAVTAELPRRLFRRVLVEEEDCRAGKGSKEGSGQEVSGLRS